jgi:hypothetical protein
LKRLKIWKKLKIDILNPKVNALLENLVNLDFRIRKEESEDDFTDLLNNFRNNAEDAPSLEEITKEVEAVRKCRYE